METQYQDDKPILTRSTSADGRIERTILDNGSTYELHRDTSGHPSTLSIDGALAWQVSWQPDGTLARLRDSNTEVQPRRHKDGWRNGVLISAPMKSGRTTEWLEKEWDVIGYPIKVTDSSGFEYRMNYDDQGRLSTFGRLTEDKKLMGTKLVYDDKGLIKFIGSSWANEKREYEDSGVLKRVEVERQGKQSMTTFDAYGRPSNYVAFDNGITTWRYDSDEAGTMLRTVELPNDGQINYSSDDSGETRIADIRMGPALVRTIFDAEGRVTTMTWGENVP